MLPHRIVFTRTRCAAAVNAAANVMVSPSTYISFSKPRMLSETGCALVVVGGNSGARLSRLSLKRARQTPTMISQFFLIGSSLELVHRRGSKSRHFSGPKLLATDCRTCVFTWASWHLKSEVGASGGPAPFVAAEPKFGVQSAPEASSGRPRTWSFGSARRRDLKARLRRVKRCRLHRLFVQLQAL